MPEEKHISNIKLITGSLDLEAINIRAKPALVIVAGLPGSGKTHFSQKLKERIGAVVIESDHIRKLIFPNPLYSAAENRALFAAIHSVIRNLLKEGKSVILDATSLRDKDRAPLYEIAAEQQARLIITMTQAPEKVIKARLEKRKVLKGSYSDAGVEVYRRMKKTQDNLKREYILVNTCGAITPFIDKIEDILKR